MDDSHSIQTVANLLKQAKAPLFVTGAGLSADSGMPTYRGVGGLYEVEDTEEGLPIEEVVNGAMLEMNPALTWKYLYQIGEATRGSLPNRGHEVIAEIERIKPHTQVMTQNVDGLHADAGSINLTEVHGRASSLFCVGCDFTEDSETFFDRAQAPKLPPDCPKCGSLIRPRVVLFGEMLFPEALEAFQSLIFCGTDLVFNVGTSAMFSYIMEPSRLAREAGIPVVEINPQETKISELADHHFRAGAAEILDRIWTAAQAS